MKDLSENIKMAHRILLILFLIGICIVLILKFYIPLTVDIGFTRISSDIFEFYTLFLIFHGWLALGIIVLFKVCDVKCDGQFFYIENLVKKDIIPINQLQTYNTNITGINLKFKVKTKLGTKIFFLEKDFQKKKITKYLDELITVANIK